jgi:hypothetical protein
LKQNKSPFKWRRFEPSLILLCVRWHCRYQLSDAAGRAKFVASLFQMAA